MIILPQEYYRSGGNDWSGMKEVIPHLEEALRLADAGNDLVLTAYVTQALERALANLVNTADHDPAGRTTPRSSEH
ncbi:MAG: hypothetical protein EON58_16980 [Alphaproteobacteria bacterium]|nr:MAG: hypothetical protein EON58_16980 [Alphaproteobacteria bacterium]